MKIILTIICLLLVSTVSSETKEKENMNEINKKIERLTQDIKNNDKDVDEKALSNTIKIYSENKNQVDEFIEEEFIKQIVKDQDYDDFDFEYHIPLPQKITEQWVKSKLEFSDSKIIVMPLCGLKPRKASVFTFDQLYHPYGVAPIGCLKFIFVNYLCSVYTFLINQMTE